MGFKLFSSVLSVPIVDITKLRNYYRTIIIVVGIIMLGKISELHCYKCLLNFCLGYSTIIDMPQPFSVFCFSLVLPPGENITFSNAKECVI